MKKYLLTGLIVLLPAALTLMILWFLFNFFTAPFLPIVSDLLATLEKGFDFSLPKGLALFVSRLFALILLVIFIFLLGAFTRFFILKNLFHWGHQIISRIPLVKTVYKVSRDIFAALFSSDGKKAFKKPIIFPFPHPGIYALGFEAGEVATECQEKISEPLSSIFMPTAPHPISGFLFLVSKKDVRDIEMSNEEAFKFLVSCGMIHPAAETKDVDDLF